MQWTREPGHMLRICLVFHQNEPDYAYKRYAYKHKRAVLGLSAIYKEQEPFGLQKYTSNERSNHFIDISVENLFNRNFHQSN